MSASLQDLITETFNGGNPIVTTVDSPRGIGGSTLICASMENWPTDTAVHFQTYQLNSSDVKIAGSATDWKAIVNDATLENLTYQGGALDSGNNIGDYVEMMPTYSWAQNLAQALEVSLNTNGTPNATLLGAIYPVGSIYTNASNPANPATLFGFGTWIAYAQGEVLAGYLAGDPNFGTSQESGGSLTHWHWQTVGADANEIYAENAGAGSGQTRVIHIDGAGGVGVSPVSSVGAGNIREDGTYTASSLQPYITVYMWLRTA